MSVRYVDIQQVIFMKVNLTVIIWNISLYLYILIASILMIQHAMFFYSYPPDIHNYVDVPIQAYFLLSFIAYLGFKLAHFVAERGEIFPSEEE